MPIIQPTRTTAPVYYPKSDYSIVKYLDLTKFISLLKRKSLFFCRLDKLEDQFEGTTAKENFDLRVNWHKQTNHLMDKPMTDEEILDQVKIMYDHEEKLKALNCINCWNKNDGESAALWKIYSDFGKGILIKSSINHLVNALSNTPEQIKLSEVIYIDYNTDVMPDGNTMFPVIHKQSAYSYENEVRLIYEIVPEFGWEYDWTKEEINEGLYIKADLDKLVQEIIIGPYSPKWFSELVRDLCSKYELETLINISKLARL